MKAALTFPNAHRSRSAPDAAVEAWDDLPLAGEKTASNAFSEIKTQKSNSTFKTVDERLARKGKRIYAHVIGNGKLTRGSAKTNKLRQAKKWLENWDGKQWAKQNGILPAKLVKKPKPDPAAELIANKILGDYIQAAQPIVKKRALRPKSPRSIRNEQYYFRPLREFFGSKAAARLALNNVDEYHALRRSGDYIAKFKVRGNDVVKKTKGGDRAVDLELTCLGSALSLAVRRSKLQTNPLRDRGRFTDESAVRHCREVAPAPDGLRRIVAWMEDHGFQQEADFTRYLAYTGLRISEGLRSKWGDVHWSQELVDVRRNKKGVGSWALILPGTAALLRSMEKRAVGSLLFPSPFDSKKPRDASALRNRLAQAAKECELPHVAPQGLRS
jgi:integrase